MIKKEDLKRSEVVFNEETHIYLRGEQRLSGITGLIHQVLQLGVYPDASDFVLKVQIPRAGYYGSCVHKAIQMWDDMGIECTVFPEKEHPTAGLLPAQEVSAELDTYKGLKPNKYRTIACEFTVDYGMFASQIDSIWADEEDDGVILVDYKTNNLQYYPGNAKGLKEYLSWQLSCYAFMFEKQTGLKVKGLQAVWLRKGEGERWNIERQPDAQVKCLLDTMVTLTDYGFVYLNETMQVFNTHQLQRVVETSSSLVVPQEITMAIAELVRAEKAAKTMKERLRELMEQNGVTKWECDEFTASIGKASESTTFDSTSFKQAYPALYKQFSKKTTRKGSFKITAK